MERDTDLQCPSSTQRGENGREQKQVRVDLGAQLACEPRGRPGQCPLAVGLLSPPVLREANQALLSQSSGLGLYCCSVAKLCQLFAASWTAAHQASLSFTVPQSLLKLRSVESVLPSKPLIPCLSLLLLPSILGHGQNCLAQSTCSGDVSKVNKRLASPRSVPSLPPAPLPDSS